MPSTTILPPAAACERGTNESQIARRLRDDVIGRKDAHHRVRVDGLQNVRGQADGGRGVALGRLGQDLVLRDLGQLAHDFVAQVIVGENPQMARAG